MTKSSGKKRLQNGKSRESSPHREECASGRRPLPDESQHEGKDHRGKNGSEQLDGFLENPSHPLALGPHTDGGRPIDGADRPALERLAVYLLRPSFAASRLHYDPEQGHIEYRTAKGIRRCLDALDWIAVVTSHIPDPGEQIARYYGRYSNASRGKRRRAATRATVNPTSPASDSEEPSAAEHFSQQRRRSWARLLRKVYEIHPLECPQCGHPLEIIAVIEQPSVI